MRSPWSDERHPSPSRKREGSRDGPSPRRRAWWRAKRRPASAGPLSALGLPGLSSWRTSTGKVDRPDEGADEPQLRGELYNVDQLARHAKVLAGAHTLAKRRRPDRLLARLRENERVLVDAYDLVTEAARRKRPTAPAEDWLLDNFHVIEEQIRTARRHLPSSYRRELPCLGSGSAAGHPRAYGIALELLAHADGRVDRTSLDGFITAYQAVAPLSLGELWAVPIMLRLSLIENLRRVASRIAAERRDEDLAQEWAERMLHAVEHDRTDLILA